MFRFSIRDMLWLTVVAAVAALWFAGRTGWQREREALLRQQEALLRQRDKDVENERRLGLLRAREAAGTVSRYVTPRTAPSGPPARRRMPDDSPIIEVPLVR